MVRTQEARCCGAAVFSPWGWSPPLKARAPLLSSVRGGDRASRLVHLMSHKEGRRLLICPATGHAVNDPVGPFCGDHGARMFSDCRSEEHTSELQSHHDLVCRLLLEKKKKTK